MTRRKDFEFKMDKFSDCETDSKLCFESSMNWSQKIAKKRQKFGSKMFQENVSKILHNFTRKTAEKVLNKYQYKSYN
jgi:hypothetical protein